MTSSRSPRISPRYKPRPLDQLARAGLWPLAGPTLPLCRAVLKVGPYIVRTLSARPGRPDRGRGAGIASALFMRNTTKKDTGTLAHELSRENDPDNPVVQELRRQTANAFVLYVNYKHYHWQTFGPLFRDMHKLFDKLAEEVLATVDELAERVRMIGQDPPGHLLDAADLATVAPATAKANM